MNLIETKLVKLPHGTLQLRVYTQRSYLSIIPEGVGQPVFKREYDYWEAERARVDFETIRRSAGVAA